MAPTHASTVLPPLPLDEWTSTKQTLHLYLQIVGKIRLGLAPKKNHWWHVPFYVSTRGLTTRPIPYRDTNFEIEFDLLDHHLLVRTGEGVERPFELQDGLAVADFYDRLFSILDELGIVVDIWAVPYDHASSTPFAEDHEHAAYDRAYVERFRRILMWTNNVFQTFRSGFLGKDTPVHLFWHSFDLAYTRFSGRRAPAMDGAGPVDQEAYSHEVISFGFWTGNEKISAPAFYSYTYPEPDGLADASLQPDEAFWNVTDGNAMALCMYDDVRTSDAPRQAVLDFLESAYHAGATRAGWDVENLALAQ
jgi:hypothetical protein